MTSTNNHIDTNNEVQGLIDSIASSPNDFKYLQVFLHRERDGDSCQEYEFLMVSPELFGKVKLLDVNVENNHVIIKILDCVTQQVGNVQIDITDNKPQTFFIRWKDVRQMVLDETSSGLYNDDLLEFDF